MYGSNGSEASTNFFVWHSVWHLPHRILLLKVPIAILRRLIIYLDDLLLIGQHSKETNSKRHTNLSPPPRPCNKPEEICANTTNQNRFSGNSDRQHFDDRRGKQNRFKNLCQRALISQQITLRELASLIGKLKSTAPAITPAPENKVSPTPDSNTTFKSMLRILCTTRNDNPVRRSQNWWLGAATQRLLTMESKGEPAQN